MSNPIQQTGVFRGSIKSYGLFESSKSQSVAVSVTIQIEEAWDEENQKWDDWREYDFEAEGDIYVINKDGNPIEGAINSLINHAGWNGDLMSVAENRWQTKPCQFSVNVEPNEKYGDKYKAAFLKAWDAIPGAGRSFLTPDKAKALADRYGSQFRALAGSVKQNATAPSTPKPSIPKSSPARKPLPQNTADLNAELQQTDADDIPF